MEGVGRDHQMTPVLEVGSLLCPFPGVWPDLGVRDSFQKLGPLE